MHRHILIIGAAGTGTSTLGQELERKLGYHWFDLDTFYWAPDKPEFSVKRVEEERQRLLTSATNAHSNWILSGSLMGWGDFLMPKLDLVIFLHAPTHVRIKRLKQREQERYGKSISPGGEREKQFNAFVDWAASYDSGTQEGRSLKKHQEWLANVNCKVLKIDSSAEIEEIVCKILPHIDNGRFWKTSQNGEIQNDSAREMINPQFEPVLIAVVDAYKSILKDRLSSIYLTGSVSRGMERGTSSDVDFFAVLKQDVPFNSKDETSIEEQKQILKSKFPWVKKFDLEVWKPEWIFPPNGDFSIFAFVIQTHSVLLLGTDLGKTIPKFKLTPTIAQDDIAQIRTDIGEAILEVNRDSSAESIKYWSARISKNIIRTCFGLVMMEIGHFTRDLDLCAQSFLKLKPHFRTDIEAVLSQIKTPFDNKDQLFEQLHRISSWLFPLAGTWLKENGTEKERQK